MNSNSFEKWIRLVSESVHDRNDIPELYHISFRDDLEGKWKPRNPVGDSKSNLKSEYPEPDLPRISLSPTIEQCFQAIYPNVKQFFEEKHFPYMEFYVYTPKLRGTERILTPKELTDKRYVHDAHMTDEYCILDPVYMQLHSKIRILNTEKSKMLYYNPFGDPETKRKPFAPYIVKYVVVKKY